MRPRGSAIVDLAVTLSVIGVMAGLAVSSGLGPSSGGRHEVVVREAYRLLVTARAEAVAQARRSVVHFGRERITAYVERSEPSNERYDEGVDTLIGQYPPAGERFPRGVELRLRSGFARLGVERAAIFDGQGFSRDGQAQLIDGTVEVEDVGSGELSRIRVTIAGVALLERAQHVAQK